MVERTIRVDFSKKSGKIKPLNGLSLGPLFDTEAPADFTAEYRELGAPYVRTATSKMPRGAATYIDISRIFPDPALDERFPESYDFSEADKQLLAIRESGAAIFLTLGEGRDTGAHFIKPLHVQPDKWARIAEKIILHYNRGWAQGHKLSVKMVEIWPGADLPGAFPGDAAAYCEFYRTVATHLKSVYPTLKVGGYSSGGFISLNRYDATDEERGYISFLETFLSRVSAKETQAPLDFFSWRCRSESAEELSLHSNYAKNFLLQYGLRRTMSIVSELSLEVADGPSALSRSYPASLASALVVAADSDIDLMLYSTLYPYSPDNALLTVDDCHTKHKYASYGVMEAYGELLRHGTEAESTENFRREIYTLAATSDKGAALMIATVNFAGTLVVELSGTELSRYSIKGMLGGGPRGEGFSTSERGIPLGRGRFTMKVGRGEIYLITLE